MLFDSHAHLAPGPDALAALLATMERLEIKASVVVPGSGISPARLAGQIVTPPSAATVEKINYDNNGLLEQCNQSGGRLMPFYFANPHLPPTEYLAVGGKFAGLKIGPAVHGVPLTSGKTAAYVQAAETFKHPVYTHCLDRDGFRVGDLLKLAGRFPQVTFILGHGGIGHLDFAAVDSIAPFNKILFETSGTFLAVAQYACEKLGSKRVLFGSEYPLQSAGAEVAKILDLKISSEALNDVSGLNIRSLLSGVQP